MREDWNEFINHDELVIVINYKRISKLLPTSDMNFKGQ
jgi:hypothetical protein